MHCLFVCVCVCVCSDPGGDSEDGVSAQRGVCGGVQGVPRIHQSPARAALRGVAPLWRLLPSRGRALYQYLTHSGQQDSKTPS